MGCNSATVEYGEIVSIAQSLHHEWRSEQSAWSGSPFEWIKFCSVRTQIVIGEKIVSSWLALHDFNIERSPDHDADRIIEGKRVEIKFSTQWNDGCYSFQNIRDANYDFIILFGISPDDAHCWVVSKKDIMTMWKVENALPQQTIMSNNIWIRLSPGGIVTSVDAVMAKYGSGLHDALIAVSHLTGYTPKYLTESFGT